MKNFFIPVLSVVLAVSVGCGYHTVISVPKPKPYPSPRPSQMLAGIAQADLTLPPGYPMSGYSINGRISRGYWIRPKATALYLRDTAGTPFVFVTTDLWAITDGQKMAVLKALSEDPATWFIGESELLLSATHAHHSSGVNELDKAFASTSIGFGIDTAAFGFTIRQIVSAIKNAMLSPEPATVSYSIKTVDSIAKNRSIEAYFRNNPDELQQYVAGNKKLETNKFYRTKADLESAIEQRLSVITVKNAQGKIKGILASYPVHPTATGDATEVYSADVFGLASSKAAAEIPDKPIVAFYNGAEGDVAPDYKFHQRYDAVRIADSLSAAIKQAIESGSQTLLNGKIIHRTATVDIASKSMVPNPADTACYEGQPARVKTAEKPVVGAAVFAGASDGRTSLSSFGISDGVHNDKWDAEQGYKMAAIDFLADDVLGQLLPDPVRYFAKKLVKINPKSRLHISIHQVGGICFTGLPGEFTTMLGRRIRKAVAANCRTADSLVSIVGLADSYISYVTTPCEYDAQFYEGASTFFGPATGPAFVTEYENLSMRNPDNAEKRQKRKCLFKGGKRVTFGPQHLGRLQTWNAGEGLHNLLVSADGYRVYSRDIPPINQARETIQLSSTEIIAYSFEDQVNAIDAEKFYPEVFLKKANGDTIPLPEHTLTVDRYAEPRSTWTVRILNTSVLANGSLFQIVVTPLSGIIPQPSGFFRIQGSGTR